MEFRNRETGEVITESQFRDRFNHEGAKDWARISEEYVNSKNFDIVFDGPQATGGTVYQQSIRQGIEQKNGKWYTKFVLGSIFSEYTTKEGVLVSVEEQELEFKINKEPEQVEAVKAIRDEFLRNVEVKIEELIQKNLPADIRLDNYAQELREIESQEGFPWIVVWPKQP